MKVEKNVMINNTGVNIR